MILKLNEETIEEINETLRRTNFAKIDFKNKTYFLAKEKVRIPKGSKPMEVFAYLKEKDELVTEFAKKHAEETESHYVTIGRIVNLREMAVQGYMVYTYFFSEQEEDIQFSEAVIDAANSHFWFISLAP
ncbi:hypothetical protein SFC55_10370 [Niallia taxi]|uniref:hypothetical protein n=1 Tax=Niallia taxi TaxID=2499688 RepID=UPI0039823819